MATLIELAEHIGAELHLKKDVAQDIEIEQLASLDDAQEGQIAFLLDKEYKKFLKITRASAVILREQDLADCSVSAIVSSDPYLAYAKIAALLNPSKVSKAGIHPSAVIAEGAMIDASAEIAAQVVIEANVTIGSNVIIGPGCFIAEGANINDYSRLIANVTVCEDVFIGKQVLIHPGVVIGSDGFGLAREHGAWVKIPQIGTVIIGDNVDIGANTTIDRGAIKNTIIKNGVKIDNLVQIAHNVVIGENTAIAGCVGIAGSSKVGKRCMLGGGVGLAGHLEIADDVTITGMSMVTKSIHQAGAYSSGWSVRDARVWRKTVARVHRLDKSK